MKRRIGYIDSVKAIAILFVVLQHAGIPVIGNYIMAFHMPLFFMIYGFAMDDEHLENCGRLQDKIKAYIVPYFIWAFIYLRKFCVDSYLRILWGTSNSLRPISQGILWYLPAFFIAVVIYRGIMKYIVGFKHKNVLICIAWLVFAVLGKVFCYGNVPENGLWFGINSALCGVSFMIFGGATQIIRLFYNSRAYQKVEIPMCMHINSYRLLAGT